MWPYNSNSSSDVNCIIETTSATSSDWKYYNIIYPYSYNYNASCKKEENISNELEKLFEIPVLYGKE